MEQYVEHLAYAALEPQILQFIKTSSGGGHAPSLACLPDALGCHSPPLLSLHRRWRPGAEKQLWCWGEEGAVGGTGPMRHRDGVTWSMTSGTSLAASSNGGGEGEGPGARERKRKPEETFL